MAVVDADIQYRLSGGAANSDPNASLGGVISATAVSAALNDFFDQVSGAESEAGDVNYRCFYVRNDAAQSMLDTRIWLETQASNPDVTIAIGLGTSAINGTEQTVDDEDTAPTGVTFSSPGTEGTALSIGDIPAGEHKAVWVRRTVVAGAAADDSDSATVRTKCDTAE